MKLKFRFSVVVAALLAVSCNVDKDYDLSNINGDNIEIGSNESEFNVPVANIIFSGQDLDTFSGNGSSAPVLRAMPLMEGIGLTELMDMSQAYLPDGYVVDVAKLISPDNESEVSGLVDALSAELVARKESRDQLALLCYKDRAMSEYDQLFELLELDIEDPNLTPEMVSDAMAVTVQDDAKRVILSAAIKSLIDEHLVGYLAEYEEINIDQDLGSVEVPSDIVDILKENLSSEFDELNVVATYEHNLPFKFELSPIEIENNGEIIEFVATPKGEPVNPVKIDIDQFVDILSNDNGASFLADMNLKSLLASDKGADYYIKIKVAMQKKGSLKFDL